MGKINIGKHALLSRREALLLSGSAGLAAALPRRSFASDTARAGIHQEPERLTTPRTVIAKTQDGDVRAYLDEGVFAFARKIILS
jgi:hypothetical protein